MLINLEVNFISEIFKRKSYALRKFLLKKPHGISLQRKSRLAGERVERLAQVELDYKCKSFFRSITSVHPRRRMSVTYKYLKRFRRKKSLVKDKLFPIVQWEDVLRGSNSGQPPVNVLEDDFVPLGPPLIFLPIDFQTPQCFSMSVISL